MTESERNLYNLSHQEWLKKQIDKDIISKKVYDQIRGIWESPLQSRVERVRYMGIDNRSAHSAIHIAFNSELTYKTKNSYNMQKATEEYQNTYDLRKDDKSAHRKGLIQSDFNGHAPMAEWLNAMAYTTNGFGWRKRAGVASFVASEISKSGAYPLVNNLIAVDIDYNDLTPRQLLDSSPFLQTFCLAVIPTPSYGFNRNYAVRLLFVLDDADWILKIKERNQEANEEQILAIVKDTYTAIANGLAYYIEQQLSSQKQKIDIDYNLVYNPTQVIRIGRGTYLYNESAQLVNHEQMIDVYRNVHKDKILALDFEKLSKKMKEKNAKREAFYDAWAERTIKEDALEILMTKHREIEDTWKWRKYMDVVGMCYYADVITEEQALELIKNVSYSDEHKNAHKYLLKAANKQADGLTEYEVEEIGLWLLLAFAKFNRLIEETEVFSDKRDTATLARESVMTKSFSKNSSRKREIEMDYKNYLSDLTTQINDVLADFNRVLINSKPGSGKSTFAMGMLKKREITMTAMGAMTYHILAYPSVQHVEAIKEEYGYDSRVYASTPTLQNEEAYNDEELVKDEIKYLKARKYNKDIHARRIEKLEKNAGTESNKQKMLEKNAEKLSLDELHKKIDRDSDKYAHTYKDSGHHIQSNHVNGKFADAVQARYAKGAYIFVTTYDSVDIVRDTISQYNPGAVLDLFFCDECHLLTIAYDFRATAINTLLRVSAKAKKVVFLTGTAEHVHHDLYDASIVTTHNNESNKVIARKFEILRIENENGAVGAMADLAEHIKDELNGKHNRSTQQILLYLENKEYHHILAHFLDAMNITYIIVNANSKSQKVVKRFLRDKHTNAQVIIATTAIAESVSVLNKNANYNTIIYNNLTSKIDSAAVIYQMASRYRNPYHTLTYIRSFCADEKVENINDTDYQNKNQGYIFPFLDLVEAAKDDAQYVVDYMSANVTTDAFKDVLERHYGVHIKRTFALDDVYNKNEKIEYAVNEQRVHYLAYAKQLQQAQVNKITNDFKIASTLGLELEYENYSSKTQKNEEEIEEIKEELKEQKDADRKVMAKLMASDTYWILYNQIKSAKIDENEAVEKLIGMGVYYDYAKLIVEHRYIPYKLLPAWIENSTNNKAINKYKNELKTLDSLLQYQFDAKSMTHDVLNLFYDTYKKGLHKYDKDGNITASNPHGDFIQLDLVPVLVDAVAKDFANLKYDAKIIKKIVDEYLIKDKKRIVKDGKRVWYVAFARKDFDYFVDVFECETKRKLIDIYIQYRTLINGEDDYYIKLARDFSCTLPTDINDWQRTENENENGQKADLA